MNNMSKRDEYCDKFYHGTSYGEILKYLEDKEFKISRTIDVKYFPKEHGFENSKQIKKTIIATKGNLKVVVTESIDGTSQEGEKNN